MRRHRRRGRTRRPTRSALWRIAHEARDRRGIRAPVFERRHAIDAVDEPREIAHRPAARRTPGARHGWTGGGKADRAGREIAVAVTETIGPAARFADRDHLLLPGTCQQLRRTGVARHRTDRHVLSLDAAFPALLRRLGGRTDELGGRLADGALARVHFRAHAEGARARRARGNLEGPAYSLVVETGEAGDDVAAMRDRPGARSRLETRTLRRGPPVGRERRIVARTARAVATATLAGDRAREP